MKIINLHSFLKGAIIFGIVLLIFLVYRGCEYAKFKDENNNFLKNALDSLILKHERDSMSAAQRTKEYEDSLQFANSQLDLKRNQLESTEKKLLITLTDVALWKQKYISVKPDNDTSVTLVDNEFIQDAHKCFDKAEDQAQLIKLYVREVHELDSAQSQKDKVQEARIRQLAHERDVAYLVINDCLTSAKRQQKILKPHGKILFSMATIAINRYYPCGVGAGVIYQDKYNRQLGVKGFTSNIGSIYTAEVNIPLSFKRKKL